ncbi:MAG TPA: hypothetical protein VG651_00730 [Stellaceae bacterium]|nr:hypothetical protein [Stellaceae bacterium]
MNPSDLHDVQGNILVPFPRDHQVFLFLTFPPAAAAADWLADIVPLISFTGGSLPPSPGRQADDAAHCGVGLSASGVRAISGDAAVALREFSAVFGAGAAGRALQLRDTDRSAPDRWLFGGPATPHVDAVVLLAATTRPAAEDAVDAHLRLAARHRVEPVFRQECGELPGALRGREHFGFHDGLGQPVNIDEHNVDESSPPPDSDRRVPLGEFVLGRARAGKAAAQSPPRPLPDWMRDGSFQVVRRLDQDVAGWRRQLDRLHAEHGSTLGLSSAQIAAKLIGRWPSGAPLARSPERDDGTPSDSFDFDDDPEGFVTPRFAHIRKMLPRVSGFPERQWRRVIRRGVPFGEPWDAGRPAHGERGLLLNAYMADIEEQFEFLIRAWANDPDFPEGGDGTDPLIGRGAGVAVLRRRGASACPLRLEQHVATGGCCYLFVPSGRGLRHLAGLGAPHKPGEAPLSEKEAA